MTGLLPFFTKAIEPETAYELKPELDDAYFSRARLWQKKTMSRRLRTTPKP